MLCEALNTASGPLLNSDKVIHNTIWISATDTISITKDCLWVCVWINEVMVHAKVVPQLVEVQIVVGHKVGADEGGLPAGDGWRMWHVAWVSMGGIRTLIMHHSSWQQRSHHRWCACTHLQTRAPFASRLARRCVEDARVKSSAPIPSPPCRSVTPPTRGRWRSRCRSPWPRAQCTRGACTGRARSWQHVGVWSREHEQGHWQALQPSWAKPMWGRQGALMTA